MRLAEKQREATRNRAETEAFIESVEAEVVNASKAEYDGRYLEARRLLEGLMLRVSTASNQESVPSDLRQLIHDRWNALDVPAAQESLKGRMLTLELIVERLRVELSINTRQNLLSEAEGVVAESRRAGDDYIQRCGKDAVFTEFQSKLDTTERAVADIRYQADAAAATARIVEDERRRREQRQQEFLQQPSSSFEKLCTAFIGNLIGAKDLMSHGNVEPVKTIVPDTFSGGLLRDYETWWASAASPPFGELHFRVNESYGADTTATWEFRVKFIQDKNKGEWQLHTVERQMTNYLTTRAKHEAAVMMLQQFGDRKAFPGSEYEPFLQVLARIPNP